MTSLASWLTGLTGLAGLAGLSDRRPPERILPDRAMTTLPLAALVVTVLVSPGLAQEAPTTAATLRGLTGVDVVVEELPTEAEVEEAGLGSSAVQEDIESQLREGGIRVLSDEEWQAAPGQPWLFVRVQMLRPQAALAGLCVRDLVRPHAAGRAGPRPGHRRGGHDLADRRDWHRFSGQRVPGSRQPTSPRRRLYRGLLGGQPEALAIASSQVRSGFGMLAAPERGRAPFHFRPGSTQVIGGSPPAGAFVPPSQKGDLTWMLYFGPLPMLLTNAGVVKLADARDSKSRGLYRP